MLGFDEHLFHFSLQASYIIAFLIGILVIPISKFFLGRVLRRRAKDATHHDRSSNVYNLSHGRLNLDPNVSMWMNMGYWSAMEGDDSKPTTLAVASRTLLSQVLATAGFNKKEYASQNFAGTYRTKAVIDLGFGCGEQTIYMNSPIPIRSSDKLWWDHQMCLEPMRYMGITLDTSQYRYAQERIHELCHPDWTQLEVRDKERFQKYTDHTHVFHGDASKPENWDPKLRALVEDTPNRVDQVWILALDTMYHFSPSRMPVIEYASRHLNANLMAFDLCLAHDVSLVNLAILRVLTALMGAPWANFVTREQYHAGLVRAGYQDIKIVDISEHVFGPLAAFLEDHDRKLSIIGLSIGPFHLAKRMFGWWARTGIVRGIIVVARKHKD